MPSPQANRSPSAVGQPDLVQDRGVDLARPVLAGRRVRQAQQIEIRAVVTRIADLAPGEQRLQRQRSAERHDLIRIGGGRQAVVHHLRDEPRNPQHVLRHRSRVIRFRDWFGRRDVVIAADDGGRRVRYVMRLHHYRNLRCAGPSQRPRNRRHAQETRTPRTANKRGSAQTEPRWR